jgi:hypothetical protein
MQWHSNSEQWEQHTIMLNGSESESELGAEHWHSLLDLLSEISTPSSRHDMPLSTAQ